MNKTLSFEGSFSDALRNHATENDIVEICVESAKPPSIELHATLCDIQYSNRGITLVVDIQYHDDA